MSEPAPPFPLEVAADAVLSIELDPPPGARVRVLLCGEAAPRVFDFAHREEAIAFYRAVWALRRPETGAADSPPRDTSTSSGS